MDNDPSSHFDQLMDQLEALELTTVHGRITEIVGTLIRAIVPQVKMSEVCLIKREGVPLMAQVIGFKQDEVLLAPLGDMTGIGPASEVIPMKVPLQVRVGPGLLGRILDGLGNPMDEATKGPLVTETVYPVIAPPPNPLKRRLVEKPLSTGVRAIDGLLTLGQGQRIGIFSGAGVGKSTLLGMISRYAKADVNVIVLIGERGREVREFLENDLGTEGMQRSVIIVATSDQAAQIRINAAYLGTAIAEYFRDQGKSVILMMDSITRFARAVRETSSREEPPTRGGFPPSLFAKLPQLLERSGNSDVGSVTALYTVLVEGDDLSDPVADEVISLLDGHIILARALANKYHFPAVDVLRSISRVLTNIVPQNHVQLIGKVRDVLANYEKNELLIRIGEYKQGSDKDADFAIKYIDRVNRFLRQNVTEQSSYEETFQQLSILFK